MRVGGKIRPCSRWAGKSLPPVFLRGKKDFENGTLSEAVEHDARMGMFRMRKNTIYCVIFAKSGSGSMKFEEGRFFLFDSDIRCLFNELVVLY